MRSKQADFNRNVHCIMGLPFDAITLAEATEKIRDAAFNRTPCFFSTPNLNFLIASQSNEAFRRSVIKSDLSLPDGMPIVWMAKLLGIPITERVAGSDVFDALRKSQGPEGRKVKVYFFGGQPGVAEMAMQKLNAEDGGLECVGFETPGFGSVAEMSSAETIQKINASGAEFLVVSLGAVKGQAWIEHNLDVLDVPVVSHLGAVVNFVAGNVNRAPRWMQKIGLEWIWRIVEEPGLWKRYMLDAVVLMQKGHNFITSANIMRSQQGLGKLNRSLIVLNSECNIESMNVIISGACSNSKSHLLRDLLFDSVKSDLNIKIDMEGAIAIDSAFWGLFSLTCAQQIKRGRSLRIEGITNSKYSFDVEV